MYLSQAISLTPDSNDPSSTIICGIVRPTAFPPTQYELAQIHNRYQSDSFSQYLLALSARLQQVLTDVIRTNPKYQHYSAEVNVRLIKEQALDSNFGYRYAFKHGESLIYAFYQNNTLTLTEAFYRILSEEHLLQMLIHVVTIELGMQHLKLLYLDKSELSSMLDYLVILNRQRPGWGITEPQKMKLIERIDSQLDSSGVTEGGLTDIDIDSEFRSLEISPETVERVKMNALGFLGTLRQQDSNLISTPPHRSSINPLAQCLEEAYTLDSQPVAQIRVLFISLGSPWHYNVWNCLSIETLAGDLIGEYGDNVHIDIKRALSNTQIDALILELQESTPDIIGVSVELGTLNSLDYFIDSFNGLNCKSDTILVLGNQVPTYFPEKFLEDPRYSNAIICLHEGEYVMRGLVEYLWGYRQLKDISNLVYIDQKTNKMIRTPLQNLDLATLPHPPTLHTVKPGITNMVQTSRGCIFGCSYCTRWKNWNSSRKLDAEGAIEEPAASLKWRAFDLQRVFENIELFVANGITEIEFPDDEFFGGFSDVRLHRVDIFADGLIKIQEKYNTKLTFRIFTTPLIIARDKDNERAKLQNQKVLTTLKKLKTAGLARVYIGLESGSASQKSRYERRETLEDTVMALKILRDLHVDIDIGFIMFDPHLTVDEMLVNVNYFKKYNLVKHNTWPFRPLVVNEGTTIKFKLEAEGLLTGRQDPDFLSYDYRFVDPSVEKIASTVQKIAEESAPIFYALKSISKSHWGQQRTDTTKFCQRAVEDNALIYLELMESLGSDLEWENDHEIFRAICNSAREKIFALVQETSDQLHSGLFDSTPTDKHALGQYISVYIDTHG